MIDAFPTAEVVTLASATATASQTLFPTTYSGGAPLTLIMVVTATAGSTPTSSTSAPTTTGPAPTSSVQLTAPQMAGFILGSALGIAAVGTLLALAAYKLHNARLARRGRRSPRASLAGPTTTTTTHERRGTAHEPYGTLAQSDKEACAEPKEPDSVERFELPADEPTWHLPVHRRRLSSSGSWALSFWRALRSQRSSISEEGG